MRLDAVDRARRCAILTLDLAVAVRPRPSVARGVVVLGMHRSGTSALTGLVALLGVSAGDDGELMAADEANRAGYWESRRLTDFQELLLGRLGGSWDQPPSLRENWEQSPRLLREVGRGRRIFSRLYGTAGQWVWKDPRTSLLLPFWRRALNIDPVVLVIHRNPLEVALSLSVRDGMPKARALELWELYNRTLLGNIGAAPMLVVSYENLMADPVSVTERVARFLATNGFAIEPVSSERLGDSIDVSLRHAVYDSDDLYSDLDVTDSQQKLAALLHSLESTEVLPPGFGKGSVCPG